MISAAKEAIRALRSRPSQSLAKPEGESSSLQGWLQGNPRGCRSVADNPETANRSDWRAACFVWVIWGVLACLIVSFVARYHFRVPYWDEWGVIPKCLGAEPLTLAWFWEQHNEHRILIA